MLSLLQKAEAASRGTRPPRSTESIPAPALVSGGEAASQAAGPITLGRLEPLPILFTTSKGHRDALSTGWPSGTVFSAPVLVMCSQPENGEMRNNPFPLVFLCFGIGAQGAIET